MNFILSILSCYCRYKNFAVQYIIIFHYFDLKEVNRNRRFSFLASCPINCWYENSVLQYKCIRTVKGNRKFFWSAGWKFHMKYQILLCIDISMLVLLNRMFLISLPWYVLILLDLLSLEMLSFFFICNSIFRVSNCFAGLWCRLLLVVVLWRLHCLCIWSTLQQH